jgi:integrase
MGKNLKGKELGKGLSQRKDGKYSARYITGDGKRVEKYFDKLQEASRWLEESKEEDTHGGLPVFADATYDEWFYHWLENIKGKTIRRNTKRNYKERYEKNIKPVIGSMKLKDVKPMHCQNVLNKMEEDYAGSTIHMTLLTMYTSFCGAVENDVIRSNPVKRTVKSPKPIEKKTRVLTKDEQEKFLNAAKGTPYQYQFEFILQTGLRCGELIGLKWEDIDFEKRTITIRRTMEFRYAYGEWLVGPPKSKSGYRTIPMTQKAYDILQYKYAERNIRKVRDEQFDDIVFLNRNGQPLKNSSYDTYIYRVADKAEIDRLSMHTLRHTFATRCIEGGMKPKTLQMILGHANIGITMNLYVHVTEEEKELEMSKVEETLNLIL